MKKNELLAQCRYYKGEEECPKELCHKRRGMLFWESERHWVARGGKIKQDSVTLMLNVGLSDAHLIQAKKPKEFIKIPLALRAFLFEMFIHYSGQDPASEAIFFRDVVLPEYLS